MQYQNIDVQKKESSKEQNKNEYGDESLYYKFTRYITVEAFNLIQNNYLCFTFDKTS